MEHDANREPRIAVRYGATAVRDARQAVEALHEQIAQPEMKALLFFCSPDYDLNALGKAIQEKFDCPTLGCTTAGEICSTTGYTKGSLVGASLRSRELLVHRQIIQPLERFNVVEAEALSERLRGSLRLTRNFSEQNHFGILLVDGMSMLEEEIISALHEGLRGLLQIGGSAGDGLNFGKTWIYDNGRFLDNAAVYALFETSLPFRIFRIQHFEPSESRMVITDSDSASRTVREINGMPAASEYARVIGIDPDKLNPFVFAAHPVMLRIGDEYYLRSIQKLNPDGSLSFFCAIDNGLVMTVARGVDLIENLRQNLPALLNSVPNAQLAIGFDCILRRLEMEQKGLTDAANEILRGIPFIGFSTYGEQFNGIHVNQTLTGVVVGG